MVNVRVRFVDEPQIKAILLMIIIAVQMDVFFHGIWMELMRSHVNASDENGQNSWQMQTMRQLCSALAVPIEVAIDAQRDSGPVETLD